jgi:hypothetical protein
MESFLTNSARKMDIHMENDEVELLPYIKMISKWTNNLNIRDKTKSLRRNHRDKYS